MSEIISTLTSFIFMNLLYILVIYTLVVGIKLLKLLIKKTKDSM